MGGDLPVSDQIPQFDTIGTENAYILSTDECNIADKDLSFSTDTLSSKFDSDRVYKINREVENLCILDKIQENNTTKFTNPDLCTTTIVGDNFLIEQVEENTGSSVNYSEPSSVSQADSTRESFFEKNCDEIFSFDVPPLHT